MQQHLIFPSIITTNNKFMDHKIRTKGQDNSNDVEILKIHMTSFIHISDMFTCNHLVTEKCLNISLLKCQLIETIYVRWYFTLYFTCNYLPFGHRRWWMYHWNMSEILIRKLFWTIIIFLVFSCGWFKRYKSELDLSRVFLPLPAQVAREIGSS